MFLMKNWDPNQLWGIPANFSTEEAEARVQGQPRLHRQGCVSKNPWKFDIQIEIHYKFISTYVPKACNVFLDVLPGFLQTDIKMQMFVYWPFLFPLKAEDQHICLPSLTIWLRHLSSQKLQIPILILQTLERWRVLWDYQCLYTHVSFSSYLVFM